MKEKIVKCDLCGTVMEKPADERIKIKKQPAGGWGYGDVTEYLDICDDCLFVINNAIYECERKKEG